MDGITRGKQRYGNKEETIVKPSRYSNEWDESKHPRAEDGKFGSGGGSSGSKAAPKTDGGKGEKAKTKRKATKEAKAEKPKAEPAAKKSVLTGDTAKAHSSPDAKDLGDGWKFHEKGFMGPAITHDEFGFKLIPVHTRGIIGDLHKEGKTEEAAKHYAKIVSKAK